MLFDLREPCDRNYFLIDIFIPWLESNAITYYQRVNIKGKPLGIIHITDLSAINYILVVFGEKFKCDLDNIFVNSYSIIGTKNS